MITHRAECLQWWRTLCFVTDTLAVSGDLDGRDETTMDTQLSGWVSCGITDVVDVRDEWTDEDFVAQAAPTLNYHHLGTHDNGGRQAATWFSAGVECALDAIEGGGKVLVHCHMGVNRAPSLAYAVLLAQGYDCVEALSMIRAARPIAAIRYADEALRWWHDQNGAPTPQRTLDRARVAGWVRDNPLDEGWIVSYLNQSA